MRLISLVFLGGSISASWRCLRQVGIGRMQPSNFLYRNLLFLNRQQRDWKVAVIRTSLDEFAYQIVFPYLSIYMMASGNGAGGRLILQTTT
jgi:hypothetical protein